MNLNFSKHVFCFCYAPCMLCYAPCMLCYALCRHVYKKIKKYLPLNFYFHLKVCAFSS